MTARVFSTILYFLIASFALEQTKAYSQKLTEPIFKDGERVCFVGNSITNNGLFYNFVNLFYATRYPDRNLIFINCGISGDVTQGVLNRMESDILVHKPTWTVLMIGMNDVSRNLYSKSKASEAGIEEKKKGALELYRKNLELIVNRLLASGSKIILQKPTIYDQTGYLPTENFFGVNDALKKCADYGQELATKYHLPTVDYWTVLTDVNKQIQDKDSTATIIGPDRVHPAGPGHLVMAYEFLKSTGGAEFVSEIRIEKNTIASNKNSSGCLIKDLVRTKRGVEFSVKEQSLPFPIAEDAASALSLIPFTDRFNKEILQVKSLMKGVYELFIDETSVGTYSSKDLGVGVNMALIKNTPQYQQSSKVLSLLTEHRKNQLTYRNIVATQIHQLPDSLKTASLETVDSFLTRRLEDKYRNATTYNYYKGQFKSYISNKKREPEIVAALEGIGKKINEINKPVFHTFKLIKKH